MSNQWLNLKARFRTFASSDWEECVTLRWGAQLLAGALPGLVIMLAIMHMAHTVPTSRQQRISAASIVPLLSASALADNPAFHRLTASQAEVLPEVQFRQPSVDMPVRSAKRVLNVIKRTSPLPVNFASPRQHWQHLDGNSRTKIDGSVVRGREWQGIVLHGSGVERGNSRLLARYRAGVQGQVQASVYHFVIGNGNGAKDGQIEVTDRWAALPEDDASISICLVGDFQEHAPTKAQLEALDELVDYLSIKMGSLKIEAHSLNAEAPTGCLGGKFPSVQILRAFGQTL